MLEFKGKVVACFCVMVAVVGCETVKRAQTEQGALAPKGRDDVVCAARVDLRAATLENLVGFALTNRPSVQEARLAVEEARLQLKTLAADAPLVSETPWTSPKLALSGSYAESSRGTTMGDFDFATRGNPSAGLSLDLLIWDFGRYDAQAKEQIERVLAAETDLVREGYVVFEEVASAYFTFHERRALLEVARTNETEYSDHLARAEARLNAGEANRLDVLKARLDLANARQETVAAANLVETSGATLMRALGIDAARGTHESVFGREAAAVGCVRRGFACTTYGVDETYAFARTNAPSMRILRARLRASSHAVDAAIADLYPTISASASLNWTDPLWVWGWGFSAAQSLFQGFRKTTAVDRAVVEMKTAAVAVDDGEQTLSVNLEVAIATRDNSAQAIESARASVRSAQENLETVRAQFAVGEASRIELSEAIAAHSRALGDCISAFYQGQRAEAALFGLAGRAPSYREEIVKGTVQ